METSIYYFSGTGNSYSIAKKISSNLKGRLISIPSVVNENSIECNADCIGIIFPRYYGYEIGIPLIVKKFISKLKYIEGKYIFAICTYGGGFGNALILTNNLINGNGGNLAAGFGIHMPQNAFYKQWVNDEKLINNSLKKCDVITKKIADMNYYKIEKQDFVFTLLTKLFIPYFRKLIRQNMANCAETTIDEPFEKIVNLSDRSFKTDSNCNGCGICSIMCPVGNIIIKNKRPLWQNKCENCLSCLNWCPNTSIHGNIVVKDYHYHHPKVTRNNLMF